MTVDQASHQTPAFASSKPAFPMFFWNVKGKWQDEMAHIHIWICLNMGTMGTPRLDGLSMFSTIFAMKIAGFG